MMIPTDAALALLELDTYADAPAGEVYAAGSDRAIIRRYADCAVLSIMGTGAPEQWISNFKAIGARSAVHPKLGVCEYGFLEGALTIWAVVSDKLGDLPLIIQGHSRGAGMVPILAGLAAISGIKPARCVLWEAPWCVGAECRSLLLSAGIDGIQYWHGDDPVPTIPAVPWLVPHVWPVKHFGEWTLNPFDSHKMSGIVADTGVDRPHTIG